MRELPAIEIHRTSELQRFGEPTGVLPRGARSGALAQLRRGSYVDSAAWRALSPELQHFCRVIATSNAARTPPIFSHESAAILCGFPIVGGVPGRVQVTVPPGSGLKSNRVVVRHEAPLAVGDVIEFDRLRVTAVDRTLIDFVASRSFLSGACAAEYALHKGLLDRARLLVALERRRPFAGSRKAAAVAAFASELSASPLETLCRVRFKELGFPQPEQQRVYRGSRGQRFEVDFYWPGYDVIGESDGRNKYVDPEFLAGRTAEEALWDEKRREDELRAQCRALVRLDWDDAWNRAGMVSTLTRAGIPRN